MGSLGSARKGRERSIWLGFVTSEYPPNHRALFGGVPWLGFLSIELWMNAPPVGADLGKYGSRNHGFWGSSQTFWLGLAVPFLMIIMIIMIIILVIYGNSYAISINSKNIIHLLSQVIGHTVMVLSNPTSVSTSPHVEGPQNEYIQSEPESGLLNLKCKEGITKAR